MTTPAKQTRTTQGGPTRTQTRPHTFLSLTPKNKGTALSTKSNILSSPQILNYQIIDEESIFDFVTHRSYSVTEESHCCGIKTLPQLKDKHFREVELSVHLKVEIMNGQIETRNI
jgi:hypothetical protein